MEFLANFANLNSRFSGYLSRELFASSRQSTCRSMLARLRPSCFRPPVPLLLALGVLIGPLHPALAHHRNAAPPIANPAPFDDGRSSGASLLGEMPIGGPIVKSNAAQTPNSDWTGSTPPSGVPAIPGVTYSNASDTKNADPSQPPPALGPAPVPLDAIRAIQVGTQRLSDAPMRVGNLDVLAPLVDSIGVLGANITKADPRLIPGNQNAPIGSDYFQINRQGQSPIILRIGQAKAWIDSNEQTLRAAPLFVGGKIYIPVFSIMPLLGAGARLDDSGTLVLSPTVESVQVFPVRDTVAITVKTSTALPPNLNLNTMKAADGSARLYIDFPGYAMGFDATNTSTERVVSTGAGDILRARAGMPSKFPAITRITLDLKRNLTGTVSPTSDPTIFAFIVSPLKMPPVITDPPPLTPIGMGIYKPLRGMTIVLDAGHGGYDSGARGPRTLEKTHTLDLIQRVAGDLRARGANVLLTRSGDYFVTLQGRVDFANTRRADLFISIHNNASDNRASTGTETFYYTAQSVGLAREIHRELSKATGCPNRGISQARFFVIRKTWMPSVLLEVAFVTNPREEGYLSSPAWCQRVADGVTRGVLNYTAIYKRDGMSG